MTLWKRLCAVLMAGALASPALAADSAEEFVKKATVSNLFEIESSELAIQRSENDAVRGFAQQMINDHTAAANGLKAAVGDSEVSAAQIPSSLDAKHRKLLDKLSETDNGRDFDKAYLDMQKDAHNEAVSLFKDYAKKGENGSIKDFAARTLPVLEQHRKHVRELKP